MPTEVSTRISAMKRRASATPKASPPKTNSGELGKGVLISFSGGIILFALLNLTRFAKLDSLLVASHAIYNVISGVKGIAEGIGQLLLGLVQMVGFAALALSAVMGVLAVACGSLRISLKLLPQLESTWNLLAHALNTLILFVALPQRQRRGISEKQPDRTVHRTVHRKVPSGVGRSTASVRTVA